MMKGVAGGLTEIINRAIERKNIMATLKTRRLVYKNMLIVIKLSMDKSCRNVSLGSMKA
jgi:hypothetical protein